MNEPSQTDPAKSEVLRLCVTLPRPHPRQVEFLRSPAPRKVVRAGRRGGKTYGAAIMSVETFLDGIKAKQYPMGRVLYATPTTDQLGRWWYLVTKALDEPIQAGYLRKNETEHLIELPGTDARIRGKTAWNADSLRGDFCWLLILDEWQLMHEAAWDEVGAPMLLDNNGRAVFIYTPPSLRSRSVTKADDPRHAAKLFLRAHAEQVAAAAKGHPPRWAVFTFPSADNPHLSREALSEISQDMTPVAYRQEILAEDVDEAPGALWTRAVIEGGRVYALPEVLSAVVVGVDPSASATGDEAGVVTCGKADNHLYVIADDSLQGAPLDWARAAVAAYHRHRANLIVAEANNGGEMVRQTIAQVDPIVPVVLVHAARGKQTRAEPVSAVYANGRGHHVGSFPKLEDEMCLWMPGSPSPNRMDALVWACAYLLDPAVRGDRNLADEAAVG